MARVLIVEDEEQVRVLAESYLREQGHHTLSAATPAETLAPLKVADGLDLLFTDLGPGGERQAGLDLAKEARRQRPDLKVLYTTGPRRHRRHESDDGRRIGGPGKALHG